MEGINFIINLDEELALLVSEAREQQVGDNDLHKLFFTYLVKSVFNTSGYMDLEYTTVAHAVGLLEDIVGYIGKTHLDIPEQEYNTLMTNVTKLQEALAVNEQLVNAMANNIIAKIYTKFSIDGNIVELQREDNLSLTKVDIQIGYTWSSHKFITKATIMLNLQ